VGEQPRFQTGLFTSRLKKLEPREERRSETYLSFIRNKYE
jgi:hypothetical protein